MTTLKARIVSMIEAQGPLSVGDYMALCLADPQHGYYMNGEPFGADGDFTTAPEISQMFGELMGVWLVAAWRAASRPQDAVLSEIGPGRGTLARDAIRTIARLEPDLAASPFVLIETSGRLTARQKSMLEGSPGRFEWCRDVDDLPDRPLFILGNELFDALPVRQYVRTERGWRERCVGLANNGSLTFVAGAGSLDRGLLPPQAAGAPAGAIFEVAPARSALMQRIAQRIARHGGAGLFIDYGHLRPGVGDTLQAVRRHAQDDVLAHPGEADLTTHVDFAALAQAARGEGLDARLTTQGDFLLRMGLVERAGRLGADAGEETQRRLTGDVERLAGPEAMGDLFKVLAIFPRGMAVPPFSEPD